jgi:hypothetical protein
MKVAAYWCPCCGGPLGQAAPIADVIASMNGHARIVLARLAEKPGYPVERVALIAVMYGHHFSGGPVAAGNVAQSIISKLRRKLVRFGWTVSYARQNGRGNHGNYRLVPALQVRGGDGAMEEDADG